MKPIPFPRINKMKAITAPIFEVKENTYSASIEYGENQSWKEDVILVSETKQSTFSKFSPVVSNFKFINIEEYNTFSHYGQGSSKIVDGYKINIIIIKKFFKK